MTKGLEIELDLLWDPSHRERETKGGQAMKKFYFASIVMVLTAFMLAGVATENASAQASPKVIEFKVATPKPPIAAPVKAFKEWAQKIDAGSGGRVKISIFPAQSLVKLADVVPSTEKGICDIGDLVINVEDRRYALASILCLPFLTLVDPDMGVKIWNEVEEKFPEMKAEQKRFKVLYRHSSNGGHLHTVKKPVRRPSDVKGMKITCQGHLATIMKSVGASPLAVPVPEWYTALDRGMSEGQIMHYHGVYETKIYELLKYHTEIGEGIALNLEQFIMNWDTWKSLPPDIQKLFDDLAPWLSDRVAELIQGVVTEGKEVMKKAGHTFIKLTLEEERLWMDAALPLHREVLEKMEKRGLPAKAVYEEAKRVSQKYRK